ncbi:MAG TPA: DUF262 domain-containing protein [Bryobacteraceae bacterium]|nr:DUF262 domain-containing protein [Bryobacteraceae bacterium]
MTNGHTKLSKVANALELGKRPRATTVRALLKWFGAERRGTQVLTQISRAMEELGVGTEPDFKTASIDEKLVFVLALAMTSPRGSLDGVGSKVDSSADVAVPDSFLGSEDSSAVNLDEPLEEPEDSEITSGADEGPVVCRQNDWNVAVLYDWHRKGRLDLQPHFQREYVWETKPELRSRLIESLLLDIPIPPIYLGQEAGGRLEVIDGQQRLTTLLKFVNNEFPLQRLEAIRSLAGKYFKDRICLPA